MRIAGKRARSLLLRAWFAAALAGAACTVFDEPPRLIPGHGGSPNSDSGSGPWWEKVNEDQCRVQSVPTPQDRPAPSHEGANLPDIYLAMTSIRLGNLTAPVNDLGREAEGLQPNTEVWKEIGFDLDNSCTNSSTCVQTIDGTEKPIQKQYCPTPSLLQQDGLLCRDNAIGNTLNISSRIDYMGGWFGIREADWNCEVRRGGFGMVFRIRGYNGQENDPNVRVDIYLSTGIEVPKRGPCRYTGEIGSPTETIAGELNPGWREITSWNIEDRWKLAASSFEEGDTATGSSRGSKVVDTLAYVRAGYLFAKLPSASELGLSGLRDTQVPGFLLTLQRASLIGKLHREPSRQNVWVLREATIAGAIKPGDMVRGFRWVGFCENMCGSYTSMVNVLNSFVDVYLDPAREPSADSVNAPCDGISIAMAVEAREAKIAPEPERDPRIECPEPRHPAAPRRDCRCPDPENPSRLVCPGTPDGGADDGGAEDGSSNDAAAGGTDAESR